MKGTSRIRILSALLALATFVVSLQAQGSNPSFCWQQNYTRTAVGTSKQCPSGSQFENGYCYPGCPSGYTGIGPVCWQNCPSGYKDIGVSCQKPEALYVAAGFVSQKTCVNETAAKWGDGCHESGLLWYPNCPSGYEQQGIQLCSPVCPSGMPDALGDCTKNTTTVGAGTEPGCGSGQDSDAGLCYPKCESGFSGVGPVCWGNCPSGTVQCGAACASSQSACQNAVGNMVLDTTAVAINILGTVFGAGPELKAGEEAKAAATQAAVDEILSNESTSWLSLNLAVGKEYALAYGKTYVKTTLKNKLQTSFDERNMFWKFATKANKGALKALNASTTQFATMQEAPTTAPFQFGSLLQNLDPTGILTLIDTFTQYGSCSGAEDFYPTPNELQFGSTANGKTMSFTLTAQQPLTVLRMASPALTGVSITPTAGNCIGRYLNTGQSCVQNVTVTGTTNLDSELRIYTDNYATIPETVHILANAGAAQTPLFVPDQDALNLASVAGAWNADGTKITIDANGSISTGGSASVFNANTRMLLITDALGRANMWYLDDSGENLIRFVPFALNDLTYQLLPNSFPNAALADIGNSTIQGRQFGVEEVNGRPEQNFTFKFQLDGSFEIAADNGQVLNVQGNSTEDGAAIIQWPDQRSANQRFLVEPLTDGNVKLISISSGEAVTVGSPSSSYAALAVQTAWSDVVGQEFTIQGMQAPEVMTKLPSGAGCHPGETLFEGQCYPVDIGYRMVVAGIEGQPCPVDWRDDGSTCWPPWTGAVVDAQANPNPNPASVTAYTMRHPLVVTSCSFYSAAKNQQCPANFQNIGGPGSCSCQAEGQSKHIRPITGHTPSQ